MKTYIKLLVLAMAAASAAIAADPIPNVLFTENFGSNGTLNRPTSTAGLTWYANPGFVVQNASGISAMGANLRYRASGTILTQFSRVTLTNPGDTLTLSFNLNADSQNGFKLGLFDSTRGDTASVGANIVAADGTSTVNIAPTGFYASYVPVNIGNGNSTTSATLSLDYRNSATNSLFIPRAASHIDLAATSDSLVFASSVGQHNYNIRVELSITLLENNFNLPVFKIFDATSGILLESITDLATGGKIGSFVNFDTIAIDFVRGSYPGLSTLSNVQLIYTAAIPEPATYAAALGALALAAVFIYRRRSKQ